MQDTVYISGLESLIAPEKVAFWPPAPAWFLLAGLILLALLLFLLRWIRRRIRNRYRRLALSQLNEILESAGNQVLQSDVQALNRLLKETALSTYPREQVAPLFGKEWLEFLDKYCTKTKLSDQHGDLLDSTIYVNNEEVNIPVDQWNSLIAEVEIWIKKHKN